MRANANASELERDPAPDHTRQRGRLARAPQHLTRQGWRDVLVRVRHEISEDNLTIVAGGVAFFAFLSVFPMLAAFVSLWGLVFDSVEVERQVSALGQILPEGAQELLAAQMRAVSGGSSASLGLGLGFSLLVSLWSANKGMKAIVRSLNIAYGENESRSFMRETVLSLGMTLSAVLAFWFALAVVVVLPAVLEAVDLGDRLEEALGWLRWPALAIFVMGAMQLLYFMGPNRKRPRWRWTSWGSVVGTLVWLACSALFSTYVTNFGSYNETYGSVGAVAALLIWFYLSAWILLLGAELNSELEHQTADDTAAVER